jgi:hypothetical protein
LVDGNVAGCELGPSIRSRREAEQARTDDLRFPLGIAWVPWRTGRRGVQEKVSRDNDAVSTHVAHSSLRNPLLPPGSATAPFKSLLTST